MNKRGQFYLLAAIIIIAVIFGIMSTTNYVSVKQASPKLYNIACELSREIEEVYDYGVYKEKEVSEINKFFPANRI